MSIKLLSENTINRIAAGEVIERPASVVKELVENAVDAGSTKIDVVLERAGKNLIIVSDNGVGMSDKDLELAVERHTTSKLDESDLLNIHTFGFRGEALPSIGSISKMLISSRLKGSDKAYQIKLIGGREKQITPSIHNEGTKIEIRDLFFATPARLKFLRTDKTELAASIDVIKKIALAHPEISISLSHEDKTLIKVKGQNKDFDSNKPLAKLAYSEEFEGDAARRTGAYSNVREDSSTEATYKLPEEVEFRKRFNLKQRIIEIIGQDFIQNAAYIDFKTPELSIYGYTSIPTFNRASAEDQFLFINNRPVKDKLLQVALRLAYQDYLARDRHPLCAVFLQIDPQLVDVNVHPTKAEVRFHDPNTIRNLLINAIKDALHSKSHIASTTVSDSTLQLFKNPFTNNNVTARTPSNNATKHVADKPSNNYRPSPPPPPPQSHFCQKLIDTLPHAEIEIAVEQRLQKESEISQKASFKLGAAKAQLHTTYIISQTEDSIVITDQHAAHERLGYEKIKQFLAKEELIKQRLLIPEIVELPDEKRADCLHENKERLTKLGLTIEKFSEKSIIVTEIPNLLGDINVRQLIHDLADHLLDTNENISLIELIEHVTETYACHYSIRAGRKLSGEEMNALLRQMEATPFSGQCNHGRPTYIELKLKDIERLFGRK